jgi:hypothetical protein
MEEQGPRHRDLGLIRDCNSLALTFMLIDCLLYDGRLPDSSNSPFLNDNNGCGNNSNDEHTTDASCNGSNCTR